MARDGKKESAGSFFWWVHSSHSSPSFPPPLVPLPLPPPTHTCAHILLCTLRPEPGADIISLCSAQRFPTAAVGSTCVALLCVCCTHSQAGLVPICIGKAWAWPITTSPAPTGTVLTRTESRHPAIPERACFVSLVLSYKEPYLCLPFSFLIFISSLWLQ